MLTERYWALPHAWIAEGLLARAMSDRPTDGEQAAKGRPARRGKIAVLPVDGLLTEHGSWWGTSYQGLRAEVRALGRDPDVSTVVLAVHSPGGGVYGAHETGETIRAVRKTKRVIAVASAEAASAAYWLAAQAHELVVTPSGQVGSVGVFAVHVDVTRLNEQMGVAFDYVVSSHAPYKVELSPDTTLSDDARAELQRTVDSYEHDMRRAIADGRGVSQTVVRETFGQGRMRRASEAVETRMADRIATLDDVLDGVIVEEVQGQQDLARQADRRLAIARLALE